MIDKKIKIFTIIESLHVLLNKYNVKVRFIIQKLQKKKHETYIKI